MAVVPPIHFPLSQPIPPNEVLSRRGLVAWAGDRLLHGQDWVLTGPPRLGKSTIAGAVRDYARAQGAYVVTIDLTFLTGQEELAVRLVQRILECRTGPWHTDPAQWQAIEQALDDNGSTGRMQDLDLKKVLYPMPPMDMWEAGLSLAETVASRDNQRLIVLLDGCDSPRIWQHLGGIAAIRRWSALRETQSHTSYGFIGRRAEQLFPECTPDDGAASADRLSTSSIPWSAWEAYLADQFETAGWTLSPAALTQLGALTRGHPWAMMAILQQTVLVAQSEGRMFVNTDDVNHGQQRALQMSEGLYTLEWVDVRESRTAPHFLAALARGQRLPRTSSVRAAQRYLHLRGITDAAGHFVDPLFAEWLRDTL